jgi:hypothetical protein
MTWTIEDKREKPKKLDPNLDKDAPDFHPKRTDQNIRRQEAL